MEPIDLFTHLIAIETFFFGITFLFLLMLLEQVYYVKDRNTIIL